MPLTVQRAVLLPQRETVLLDIADGKKLRRGEYSVRGGLCWPTATTIDGVSRLMGWAVCGALDVKTDIVTILGHQRFNSIEPIEREGRMVTEPLGPWLLRMWAECYCLRFYWKERWETNRQFRSQVHASDGIIPKPKLREVFWTDDGAADQVLAIAAGQERLVIPRDLHNEIRRTKAGEFNAARHALVCLLFGMQAHRWREPDPQDVYENGQ